MNDRSDAAPVPHDPTREFYCAGCAVRGFRVEWPNGCSHAQNELSQLYPADDALLLHLMTRAVLMGRETSLPPAKCVVRLTRWTGMFSDHHYDIELPSLPAQRVGRPAPGAVPRSGPAWTSG